MGVKLDFLRQKRILTDQSLRFGAIELKYYALIAKDLGFYDQGFSRLIQIRGYGTGRL
jgi:hypothetical protein